MFIPCMGFFRRKFVGRCRFHGIKRGGHWWGCHLYQWRNQGRGIVWLEYVVMGMFRLVFRRWQYLWIIFRHFVAVYYVTIFWVLWRATTTMVERFVTQDRMFWRSVGGGGIHGKYRARMLGCWCVFNVGVCGIECIACLMVWQCWMDFFH